jgi:excisionase family DNA binding protein
MSDELAAQILDELRALRAEVGELRAGAARVIPDRPMSIAEAATVLSKSPKTVRRWMADGKLRVKREGRVTLITPDALRKFLAS